MKKIQVLKRVLSFFKIYRGKIILILALLFCSTFINLILPFFTQSIIDDGLINNDVKHVIAFSFIILFLYFLDASIDVIKEKVRLKIYTSFQYRIKKEAFTHLMKLPTMFYKKTNCTEILQSVEDDVASIVDVFDSDSFFVITEIFGAIGGSIALFYINWKLALIVFLYIPIKFIVSQFLSSKNYIYVTQFINLQKDYSKWFGDALNGVVDIKQFGILSNKLKEFEEKQTKLIKFDVKKSIIGTFNIQTEKLLIQILMCVLYIFAAKEIMNVDLTIGGFVSFISFSLVVTEPLSSIVNVVFTLSEILPAAKRYFEFMDLSEEDDKKDTPFPSEYKKISFRNISFSYENNVVFSSINGEVFNSEKIAIVGGNGAGKTTLINILQKNLIPSEGEILIDNLSITSFSLDNWRKKVAAINQDIYLFDDTIKSNLCLYREIDCQKINCICNDLQLNDLIADLSMDHEVGNNGANISGGQKQKIAIARVLLSDAEILIFDEATSNLDNNSMDIIEHLFTTRLKNKTVFFVTHTPRFLDLMDKAILLKNKTGEFISISQAKEFFEKEGELH